MLNSPAIIRRVEAPSSRAHTLIDAGASPAEIAQRLYLATLGRRPTAAESAVLAGLLEATAGEARMRTVEDLQYALINKVEFVFNH